MNAKPDTKRATRTRTGHRCALPASRKGIEWIQIFLVMMFALFVVVGVVLLSFSKGRVDPLKPQLDTDLGDQSAHVTLAALLRWPTGTSLLGNGQQATLSDLIIISQDGKYDDEMLGAVRSAFPSKKQYVELTILYPSGRRLLVKNSGSYATTALTSDAGKFAGWPQGYASLYLPSTGGNIEADLLLVTISDGLTLQAGDFEKAVQQGSFAASQQAQQAAQQQGSGAGQNPVMTFTR